MPTNEPFARWDEEDDATFYRVPRLVTHIEAGAIEALRSRYGQLLDPGSRVLDLMSSWRSHLPPGLGEVVGLGMNAEEMAANPQLDRFVVTDLNADPVLPFEDASFDGVVCSVSVQYLVHPIEVWREAGRVLRPGGVAAVAFSNRCFPTKAVALWLTTGDDGHRLVVRRYLEEAGFWPVVDEQLTSPDDPVFVVSGRRRPAGSPPA